MTEQLGSAQGPMIKMINHGFGRVRLEFRIPSRGLIGFRGRVPDRHARHRPVNTSSTAGSRGGRHSRLAPPAPSSPTAPAWRRLRALQSAGARRVVHRRRAIEVYEGMIIGENARADDIDVNVIKEKKLTNMRASTADEAMRLVPPRASALEQAIEFIATMNWWKSRRRPSGCARRFWPPTCGPKNGIRTKPNDQRRTTNDERLKSYSNAKPAARLSVPRCGSLSRVATRSATPCGRANPGLWGFGPVLRRFERRFGLCADHRRSINSSLRLDAARIRPGIKPYAGGLSFLVPSDRALQLFGMSGAVPVFVFGAWWTLLSASWLHGNLLHILFNMMWVPSAGSGDGRVIGPSRTVIIYTVAGIVRGFSWTRRLAGRLSTCRSHSCTARRYTVAGRRLRSWAAGGAHYCGRKSGSSLIRGEALSYAITIASSSSVSSCPVSTITRTPAVLFRRVRRCRS